MSLSIRTFCFVAILFSGLAVLAFEAGAATRYVNLAAAGNNDGSSWEDAFANLQSALAVAVAGDEIWVAEGTYRTAGDSHLSRRFYLVEGVGLYGGFKGSEAFRTQRDSGLYISLLTGTGGDDAPNCYDSTFGAAVVDGSGVGPDTIIDGFTITAPHCTHFPESAGMRVENGSPTISNLVFTDSDGAIPILNIHANPSIEGVLFVDNTSRRGGGIYNSFSNPTIRNADFVSNSCGFGGGIFNYYSNPVLQNVRFVENSGQSGIGIYNLRSSPLIIGATFERNSAADWGSGIMNNDGSNPILINIVFDRNSGRDGGAGMANFHNSSPELTNVTFSGNFVTHGRGGAIFNSDNSNPALVNTVCWGNDASVADDEISNNDAFVTLKHEFCPAEQSTYSFSAEQSHAILSAPRISYSLIRGSGASGPSWDGSLGVDLGNNLDADPLFADVSTGDLRLLAGSPAVNSGDNSALAPTVLRDLDGHARFVGSAIDMGAYELQSPNCMTYEVAFGASWDGVSLQQILDAEYGAGAIDAATDYEGYQCGDAVVPYWIDDTVEGWIVRELAGFQNENVMGWYAENYSTPTIDGIDDSIVFAGPMGEGATAFVPLSRPTRFALYLDPRGANDSPNAPQPEVFFTNRRYNDRGPDGSGELHAPDGGDPQALIYNVTHLRGGVPTYVVAWEDLDSGAAITPTYTPTGTDNDFNDLVVEIRGSSPVPAVVSHLEATALRSGVRLRWNIQNAAQLSHLEIERRLVPGLFVSITSLRASAPAGEWTDTDIRDAGSYAYRVRVQIGDATIESEEALVSFQPGIGSRPELRAALPNPFNPQTTIEYALPARESVALKIYDLAGRLVRTMELGEQAAGVNSARWDGADQAGRGVATGVYVLQLVTRSATDEMRVVLLK